MRLTRRATLAAGLVLTARAPRAQPAPLRRRPIPSSGEELPVIGLGTARRYADAADDAALAPLRETVRTLVAQGGSVIDTAPSYGNAEDVVGRIVESLGIRDRVFLATKVGVNTKEEGQAEIAASFRKLRTERIDLIAVHNLRDITNQLATLRDLKQQGRIRYVGATTSFARQYADFEAMMRRERLDAIQIDYALDNRASAERIIPLARDRGMAVFINLPFGRERLFSATRGKPLPDWAAEFGATSWAQFFLKYILGNDAVTCVVPGMAQARYVTDNLGAARGALPDAATRRRMEAFIDAL